MTKVIFGIFAHPDDETFGMAGTIAREASNGTDVYLISLTAGEAGANPDKLSDLGAERQQEAQAAVKILGAKSWQCLGYPDSHLDNSLMIEATPKISSIITSTLSDYPADSEVELISFELGGISGHLDHIAAARATSQIFYRLAPNEPRIKCLRQLCMTADTMPQPNTDWIFMDKGIDQCDQVIDVEPYRQLIIQSIKAHKSQRGDASYHLDRLANTAKLTNSFMVRNRP